MSTIFKDKEVLIPENTITIIKKGQNPIFQEYNFVENDDNVTIDTSRNIVNKKFRHLGREWMKKYKSGIRFEFSPQ